MIAPPGAPLGGTHRALEFRAVTDALTRVIDVRRRRHGVSHVVDGGRMPATRSRRTISTARRSNSASARSRRTHQRSARAIASSSSARHSSKSSGSDQGPSGVGWPRGCRRLGSRRQSARRGRPTHARLVGAVRVTSPASSASRRRGTVATTMTIAGFPRTRVPVGASGVRAQGRGRGPDLRSVPTSAGTGYHRWRSSDRRSRPV
jgi:hypothetical protein